VRRITKPVFKELNEFMHTLMDQDQNRPVKSMGTSLKPHHADSQKRSAISKKGPNKFGPVFGYPPMTFSPF